MNEATRHSGRRLSMLIMSALFTVSALAPAVASAEVLREPVPIQKPGH